MKAGIRAAWTRVPSVLRVFLFAFAIGLVYLFLSAPDNWYSGLAPTSPAAFAPSAMFALGHGLVQPKSFTPELQAFLNQEIPRLPNGAVSSDMAGVAQEWDLRHQYLLYTVGCVWRVTGVSWPAVKLFLAFAYALSFLLAYSLFRLAMRPAIAFVLVVLAMVPGDYLYFFSSIRDGLKAPFFYAVFLLLALLIKYTPRLWHYLGIALALGLTIGIGLGFRHDLVVALPPALICVFLCRRPVGERAWLARVMALALLSGSYLLVSAPVREVVRSDGLPGHDVTMGFAAETWDRLGLDRSSYEYVFFNNDEIVTALAMGWLQRNTEETHLKAPPSVGEEVGQEAIIQYIGTHLPFDLLLRMVMALLWVLAGAENYYTAPDQASDWGYVADVWISALIALLAFWIVARRRLGAAWLTALLFAYFSACLTLQFQYRHAFHLTLAAPFVFGFLLDQWRTAAPSARPRDMLRALLRLVRRPRIAAAENRLVLLSITAVGMAGLLTLAGAFLVQRHQFGRMIEQYDAAPLRPLEMTRCSRNGWTLLKPSGLDIPPSVTETEFWLAREDYLVVDLEGADHDRPLWLVYRRLAKDVYPHGFSYRVFIPATAATEGGRTRAFIPLYHTMVNIPEVRPDVVFAGIALQDSDAGAFRAFAQVENVEDFAMLPLMWIPQDRSLFRDHRWFGLPRYWYTGETPPITAYECDDAAAPAGSTAPAAS